MPTVLHQRDFYATPEEYLARERISETKHEYLAGVIFAMAGASRAHNLITGNIFGELRNQLRGKSCIPFGSDMRLRIHKPGGTFYYYPDVAVDCSGSEGDELEGPTVIFEVMSTDSARADRGDKLMNYQSIISMSAYVLVDQFRPAVTVYRRAAKDAWAMEFLGDAEGILRLPEIDCALPMRVIYERVLPAG